MWGEELTCPEDVFEVFTCYLSREPNRYGAEVSTVGLSTLVSSLVVSNQERNDKLIANFTRL